MKKPSLDAKRKGAASLAFGKGELVAGRAQGAQVYAVKARVFCPRHS